MSQAARSSPPAKKRSSLLVLLVLTWHHRVHLQGSLGRDHCRAGAAFGVAGAGGAGGGPELPAAGRLRRVGHRAQPDAAVHPAAGLDTPGAAPLATWSRWVPVPCRCSRTTSTRPRLPLGPGVGLMTLQYVFHKTTVLLYATVMLLLQHRWLAANTTGVMRICPWHMLW